MKKTRNIRPLIATTSALVLSLLASGCISTPEKSTAANPYRDQAIAMIKRDFQPKGIAGLERLNEDPVQALCNQTGNTPPADAAMKLQTDMLAAIKLPADGKFMGDFKEGEKLAQSGRGFTWTDKPGLPVGGNCYNCHQISPNELSFGTVSPESVPFRQESRQHAGNAKIRLQQNLQFKGLPSLLGNAAIRLHWSSGRKADQRPGCTAA